MSFAPMTSSEAQEVARLQVERKRTLNDYAYNFLKR